MGQAKKLRANNAIESWNVACCKKVQRTKPNTWLAIRFLKGKETLINATLRRIERTWRTPVQRRKWRDLNENITVFKKREISANEQTLDEYWLSIEFVCAKVN